MISCLPLVALLLTQTSSPAKLTLEFPPTPLPKLLAQIQASKEMPLVCVGTISTELVAAKFTDVDRSEILKRLAETLRATWTTLPDGSMRLARTPAQDADELNDGFNLHAKDIAKEIAKIPEPAPLTPQVIQAKEEELGALKKKRDDQTSPADYTVYQQIESISHLAMSRLVDRVARRLNPNYLARLPQFGAYPLVDNPVGTQLSAPEDMNQIINLWRAEAVQSRDLMGQSYEWETRPGIDKVNLLAKNGMPFVWIQASFGQISLHVKIVGEVQDFGGVTSFTRNIGTPLGGTKNEVSSFAKTLTETYKPGDRSLAFCQAVGSALSGKSLGKTPVVHDAILGYKTEDPVAVATGDFWLQLGMAKKSDYLVRVPDYLLFLPSLASGSQPTIAAVYAEAESTMLMKAVEHPGYFALIPSDADFYQHTHIPRPELAAVLNRLETSKILDVDGMANYIGKTDNDILGIFGLFLAGAGAGVRPDMTIVANMDALRIYGRLSPGLRTAAKQNGTEVRLDNIGGPFKVACDALVYRTFSTLRKPADAELPPPAPSYNGLASVPDIDPSRLPAIQFPRGYPGGSLLKVKLTVEPHLFQVFSMEAYVGTPMITELASLASTLAFQKKYEEFGIPQPFHTKIGYGNSEHLTLRFEFPSHGILQKEAQFAIMDGTMKVGDISLLPEKIRKELEAEIAKDLENLKNLKPEDLQRMAPLKPPVP